MKLRKRIRSIRRQTARRGVTIVEMLVAVSLFTIAGLGLMSVSGSIAATMGNGMKHSVAAGVAQSRLDSLSSLACASLQSGASTGSSTTRSVHETWQVIDGRNIKTIIVTVTIPRRATPLKYETIVPCRD